MVVRLRHFLAFGEKGNFAARLLADHLAAADEDLNHGRSFRGENTGISVLRRKSEVNTPQVIQS